VNKPADDIQEILDAIENSDERMMDRLLKPQPASEITLMDLINVTTKPKWTDEEQGKVIAIAKAWFEKIEPQTRDITCRAIDGRILDLEQTIAAMGTGMAMGVAGLWQTYAKDVQAYDTTSDQAIISFVDAMTYFYSGCIEALNSSEGG